MTEKQKMLEGNSKRPHFDGIRDIVTRTSLRMEDVTASSTFDYSRSAK